MSAPDYNDPESKLRLNLASARPGRFMRTYGLAFFQVWRAVMIFMAMAVVPIGYFELKDHGFRWSTIGGLVAILALLGVFFVIGTLALRSVRALSAKRS